MEVTCHLPDDPTELVELSDVVLCAEGQEFPVHSQVLAAYSGFFRGMLHGLKNPLKRLGEEGCSTSGRQEDAYDADQCGKRRMRLNLKDVGARELAFMLKYLYTQDMSLLKKMDDAKTLVDLAQRFDVPSIIRNCVPWVSQNTSDLVLNAYATHFDAIYWLNLAEAWGFRELQVACMAAIADEIAFYSVGEGEYWSSFDVERSQSISSKVLFIISRAVAEACSRQLCKRDIKDRLAELERIISRIMEQGSRGAAAAKQQASRAQDAGSTAAAAASSSGAGSSAGARAGAYLAPPPPVATVASSSGRSSGLERVGCRSTGRGGHRSPSLPKAAPAFASSSLLGGRSSPSRLGSPAGRASNSSGQQHSQQAR